ncbi:hypothetical protein UCRPC4_g06980 [Phaeomoniella chlamydospora]|uniref:BTB domain-containing protein n=1 Tax=Phaeomoniella chlamydospora TaxID=158046 RepID=A0A0G2G7Z4_PHACM|nr:hypothetical protein UCRPC4_g06980 [Phaeomoniella chlamydospora]
MTALNCADLLSPPFRFLIGNSKDVVAIHTDLVARHSTPLRNLMKGEMVEAQTGFATIHDVDLATFLRFAGYVYLGDYDGDSPEETSSEIQDSATLTGGNVDMAESGPGEEAPTHEYPAPEAQWDWRPFSHPNPTCKRCKRPLPTTPPTKPVLSKKEQSWEVFTQNTSNPASKYPSLRSKSTWTKWHSVFLSHARIYVFADKYDIPSLGDLSIQKLRESLVDFNPCSEQLESLYPLIRYTYDNTPDRGIDVDQDGNIDALRDLVNTYLAFILEHVLGDPEMTELVVEKREFASDLLLKLSLRLY